MISLFDEMQRRPIAQALHDLLQEIELRKLVPGSLKK